jgi:hypothetical protein
MNMIRHRLPRHRSRCHGSRRRPLTFPGMPMMIIGSEMDEERCPIRPGQRYQTGSTTSLVRLPGEDRVTAAVDRR